MKMEFGCYSDEELAAFGTPPRYPRPSSSLLLEAHNTVHAKRSQEYGSFADNMTIACRVYNALRPDAGLTPDDGTWFLICLKLAREACRHKRDNLLDAAGYLELLDELLEGGSTMTR